MPLIIIEIVGSIECICAAHWNHVEFTADGPSRRGAGSPLVRRLVCGPRSITWPSSMLGVLKRRWKPSKRLAKFSFKLIRNIFIFVDTLVTLSCRIDFSYLSIAFGNKWVLVIILSALERVLILLHADPDKNLHFSIIGISRFF